MTKPLASISPADLRALKVAIRAAAKGLAGEELCPAEKSRYCNQLHAKICRRYGISKAQELPAAALGDALRWLREQSPLTVSSIPTGLEARAAEARASLRAATNGLYQYRLALQGLRRAGEELQRALLDQLRLSGNGPAWAADALYCATAGGFVDLENELCRLKDRAEAHALALVRLARSLEQQGAR